jgi:hypothetical protein
MDGVFVGEGLAEAAELAAKLAQDRGLRRAMASLFAADPKVVRAALTAPREYLAGAGVELPDHLEVVVIRGDHSRPHIVGRFVPDFEFFVFRQFDCRTYWVAKKDGDGKFAGYEEQQVCWGFEITPKFLPGGPIS